MFSEQEGVTWENDPEEQLKRLKAYFNAIDEGQSLVFFYTNHGNPLIEETGERLLIGVARIVKKGEQIYFPKTPRFTDDYPLWSRAITVDHPHQSVVLPYQEYIKNGHDPSNIVCRVPNSLRPQFSYVSEQLTDDDAVVALEAMIQVARTVQREGKTSVDWSSRIKWLDQVLAETWRNRGAYPGIGSVLKHLGAPKGTIYQVQVLQELSAKGKDARKHIIDILERRRAPEREFKAELEQASSNWRDLSEFRKKLLSALCLFELSKDQVDRVANSSLRREAGITATVEEIIDNPYVLCEQDQGGKDSLLIGFGQIDHGMIPLPDVAKAWGKRLSITPNDKRRVRALIVGVLKSAAQEGDTLLSISDTLSRVRKRLPEERACNPDPELII